MTATWLEVAVGVTLATPLCLLAILGVGSLSAAPLPEVFVGRMTRGAMIVAFCAASLAWLLFLAGGSDPLVISFGRWFTSREAGFAFDFLVDGLSLPFATLSLGISGIVAAFSHRYLHREPGYNRYFVLFAVFVSGITLVALAGSIEVLFAGWELLGLSSALLVGFFWERRAPVVNALRVFAVYRVSDAAMLAAAVLLHHWAGSGSLERLFSGQTGTVISAEQATIIAVLLIAAVAGKSGLLPFSGWLPRAMEGPTPSSAVFYGALSIHAGCFLLLRAEPLLAHSPLARALAVCAGATTAVYATLVSRAQPDVKSTLAYAALSQVGVIVVEIALGFTTLALVHIVGHASFRLVQFLSAPNILHDLHELEGRLGSHVRPDGGQFARLSVWRLAQRPSVYLFALEGGFLDSIIDRVVVEPFTRAVAFLDRFDRALCGREGDDD